jgi:hypothetical protein
MREIGLLALRIGAGTLMTGGGIFLVCLGIAFILKNS